MNLRTIKVLSCAIVAYLTLSASSINLQSKHYSVRDGLICNTINAVTQDRDGFIWLATSNGFSRFDGYSFVNFTQLGIGDKTETGSNISLLLNDTHNGLVWGYTPQQAIYCYDQSKGRFVDYTGKGDIDRPFGHKCISYDGMWLYSNEYGARHIIYKDGTYSVKDYTEKNHLLQSAKDLAIYEDRLHNIWMPSSKGLQRITPDGKCQVLIKNADLKYRTLGDQCFAVMSDKGDAYLYSLDGKLKMRSHLPSVMPLTGKSRASMFWNGAWYIFTEGDTYAMDLKTGRFFKPAIQIPYAIDKNTIPSYYCFYDKKGNLYLFYKKNKQMKKLHLLDDPALINARDRNFSVAEDSFGKVFIATFGNGLYCYIPKQDELLHFSSKDATPLFDSDFLLNIFIDKYNCIWLTGNGLYRITEIDGLKYQYVRVTPNERNEWSNFVRHLSYIGNNQLVACTRTNDNYLYNTQTGSISCLPHTNATIYSYKKDPQGHTWIATKGDGFSVDGQAYPKITLKGEAPINKIYDFAFDSYGRTWIGTWEGGLLLTQYQKGKPLTFKQFLNQDNKESQIHDLLLDREGRLWASTSNGIIMVDTKKKNISPKDFHRFNSQTAKLPTNMIINGIEIKDGSLWFATNFGVLKCQYEKGSGKLRFETFNTSNGLINNSVRTVAEDHMGNIWATTEDGLSRIDTKTKKMTSFLLGDHVMENNFSENCHAQLPDGTTALGTQDGILLIKPEPSKYSTANQLKVTITDMTINGISVNAKTMEGLLEQGLSHTKEITLPYDQNSLSISFSNFFYPETGTTMYQYYLEGLDHTWRPMTSINHADYSELRPGHYTLHLRTLNPNNKWSEETLLEITIREPWYNTWWAWMLYLIILGGIGGYIYRAWRRNFDLQQEVKLEKQMSDFRIDFFTHISHEFRTPLSIIQSAVEKLKSSENASYINKQTLLTLNRGSKRMQRLINQLMEFRKANTGNMKLTLEQGDIVSFVRNIYNDIYTIAKQKDLSMSFTPTIEMTQMAFDHQKVETITYNLLSNAVKYTPDKGSIMVKTSREEGYVKLSVEDNGPGIKLEQEKELFKPFMHGYVSKGGMGIGLYTAHEMALLHKGSLTYQRSQALGGSLFILTLPTDESIYSPGDFVESTALETSSIDHTEIDELVKEMTPEAINNVTVMVIEDDPDMMEQIKGELSVYFKVESFMNGKTGYENIKKVKPALLITDIMLPEMSGYEIVSNMKADPETQNIPVIMLTAFDDVNHMLKAYKNFVDDYMVKPCNFKLLIARALQFVSMDMKAKQDTENHTQAEIPQQETETEKATDKISTGGNIKIKPVKEIKNTETAILMSTLDKKFKDKLEYIVAQHIGDNSFSVDRLAELLGLGRTTVYNRTKSIMGVSPNIYIQNERLRTAAKLLLEGEYTVSEISEKVGFSDATYFYKCFKNKYGIAPSKYGK